MTGHILALSGGVGGAKLAAGLCAVLPPEQLTIVVNTGDPFAGLWYTVAVVVMAFIVALIWLPETKDMDIH